MPWIWRTKNISVKGDPQTSCLSTIHTIKNMGRMRDFFRVESRVSVRIMPDILNLNRQLSSHFRPRFTKMKLNARVVPYALTDEQKEKTQLPSMFWKSLEWSYIQFGLFPRVNMSLKCKRHQTFPVIKEVVTDEMKTIPEYAATPCFSGILKRWYVSINSERCTGSTKNY